MTDDLRRSRLTVFFRLLLAIPHFLWLALWGTVVLIVVVLNWFATLIRGRSPQGFHDFLAGFLRYVTHVEAYVSLAANPYPAFFLGSVGAYPIDLEIAAPEPQNRWKTLLRMPLFVPAALLLSAFFGGPGGGGRGGSYGGAGTVGTAAFLAWFASLVRGRAPRGLRDLVAWGLGYSAQATAYLFLLTDRYPYTGPGAHLADAGEVDAEGRPRLTVADDLRRSRLTVFFRFPLAFPHLVWLVLWGVFAGVAAVLNWLAALALGRSPRPLARFLAAYVRYQTHVYAFLSLVGNPFPGFVGKPGGYPIDLEFDPFAAQRRWVTLVRALLAVPAVILASAIGGLLLTAALLAWFASLATGRAPRGLRDAGAYALGYAAQLFAYLFVLTDRYPHASPLAVVRAA